MIYTGYRARFVAERAQTRQGRRVWKPARATAETPWLLKSSILGDSGAYAGPSGRRSAGRSGVGVRVQAVKAPDVGYQAVLLLPSRASIVYSSELSGKHSEWATVSPDLGFAFVGERR